MNTSESNSSVMTRTHTLFLNEVDPQFGTNLDTGVRKDLVKAQLNLGLLLNASVAISDANALHNDLLEEYFTSPTSLGLLHQDDWLTELAGGQSPVSPIRICLRDNCRDLVELDQREVQTRGSRRLHLTALSGNHARILSQNSSDTTLRFSLANCGMELTDYCRPLFQDETGYGFEVLRQIDEEFAAHIVRDFQQQVHGTGTYKLASVYELSDGRPQEERLRDEFLALTKPGYQRGVPSTLDMPMTVAYRRPGVIEPKAALTPVPIEYSETEVVLTSWGMEVLAQLSTEQVVFLRGTSGFKEFIGAKTKFMRKTLARQATGDSYREMLKACRTYLKKLDEDIRTLKGLARKARAPRCAIVMSKFKNQLTLTNCVRGVFLMICTGTEAICSYYAGQQCFDGNWEAMGLNLAGAVTAIGAASISELKLQGAIVLGFSSQEREQIEEAKSNLWFHEPFQVSSYFGGYGDA